MYWFRIILSKRKPHKRVVASDHVDASPSIVSLPPARHRGRLSCQQICCRSFNTISLGQSCGWSADLQPVRCNVWPVWFYRWPARSNPLLRSTRMTGLSSTRLCSRMIVQPTHYNVLNNCVEKGAYIADNERSSKRWRVIGGKAVPVGLICWYVNNSCNII